jgi:hypothetical protein
VLKIQTSADAKNYAIRATSGHLRRDQAIERLEIFRGYLSRSDDEQHLRTWQTEIDALEKWLESDVYKSGSYPQGIDELMLELVEWRAALYAFELVETQRSPFKNYVFYQQWLIGGAYCMFSLLGKLTGKFEKENSLRNLWKQISKFIEEDGACKKDELHYIEKQLDKISGQFTKENSKAIFFRHTVIAHNEKSVQIRLDEIDNDVHTLIRIWSLIVSWSSFGILYPFRSSEQAFEGLEGMFSLHELISLKAKRSEYIDQAVMWSQTHLHDGQLDMGRGPFAAVSIVAKIHPN